MKNAGRLIRGVLAAFILGLAYTAGYFLAMLLFRITETPPDFLRYLISGSIGVFIVWVLFFRKMNKKDAYIDSIFNALDNIAHGNFNIEIKKDENGRFNELAKSITKMAEGLGTMEHMRQDFISNVSHEFQSPLTSIGGYAALLRKDGATLKQIEYATIIEEESKRLSKLADNLLMLSALETDDTPMFKSVYRLDRQLENVLLLLEHQWAVKNIEPEISLPKTDFYGNEDLMKQVWINLLVNAIKFTPDSGEIKVSIKSEEDSVECHISDSGIGISPADQMRIFERFYKVDKARDRSLGGNGLGLSLVKKIAELHGGSVKVESKLGKGTTFKVVLPKISP